MKLVFICKDGHANSLLSNLVMAMEAKKGGADVGVMFTEEALAALTVGTFLWPVGLHGSAIRWTAADAAKAMGLPIMGRGQGRQIDAVNIVGQAEKAGLAMFACPLWTKLLNVGDKLPKGIKQIDMPAALKKLSEANQVIGNF